MYFPGDDWISPEATPKLIKLLQKNKKLTGSYGYNHYKKVGKIYYFNGESFHEDGRFDFEGKITEVKVMTSKEKKC